MSPDIGTIEAGHKGVGGARQSSGTPRDAGQGAGGPGPEEETRMSSPADLEELGRRIRKLRVDRRMTLK
jgi:hypothetical protein